MNVTAADVHGPWVDRGWESWLVEQVLGWWSVPIGELPDAGLALLVQQGIAVGPVLAEVRRRLAEGRAEPGDAPDRGAD